MDFRTAKSEDLIVVGWKDNKSVYLASNCDSVNPVSSVERWNRVVQAKVLVPQPHLIKRYNQGMGGGGGGVDRADQNIAAYRIAIRSKKWWWALFAWIPDMVVQNAWTLYRINKEDGDPAMDFLAFRREIVGIYFSKYSLHHQKVGRPRGRILPANRRVPQEVRFDGMNHYRSPLPTTKRCAVCGKTTKRGCLKCNSIGIHDHCFEQWHDLA